MNTRTGATDMNGRNHWIGVYDTRRGPEQGTLFASVTRIVLGAAIISAVAVPLTIDVNDIALEKNLMQAGNMVTGSVESAIGESGLDDPGSAE
jgi:hypothetical protein